MVKRSDGRPDPVKHIKWHRLSNGSWAAYWQRALNTTEEQQFFDGKIATRYIGVVTEREADTRARALDADHDRRMAAFRSLLPRTEPRRLQTVASKRCGLV